MILRSPANDNQAPQIKLLSWKWPLSLIGRSLLDAALQDSIPNPSYGDRSTYNHTDVCLRHTAACSLCSIPAPVPLAHVRRPATGGECTWPDRSTSARRFQAHLLDTYSLGDREGDESLSRFWFSRQGHEETTSLVRRGLLLALDRGHTTSARVDRRLSALDSGSEVLTCPASSAGTRTRRTSSPQL